MSDFYTPDDIRLDPTLFLVYRGIIREFYDANEFQLLETMWHSTDRINHYRNREEHSLT
jgi:hypothetical protein